MGVSGAGVSSCVSQLNPQIVCLSEKKKGEADRHRKESVIHLQKGKFPGDVWRAECVFADRRNGRGWRKLALLQLLLSLGEAMWRMSILGSDSPIKDTRGD